MTTFTKHATLDILGLPGGDHVVRFHVEGDAISFEVAETVPSQRTGLLQKESGPKLKGQTDLETYRRQVAAARAGLVDCPWDTTAAAMLALREGEAE